MCGICGIALSSGSHNTISRATIERMRDVLTHRGPDGAGIFIEEGIALGHRRLSIVDVAHGQQPMASDDGTLQIVYNGEVYNHPTLSAELKGSGIRYHTHCDTETVLRIFQAEGARAPERLRGMFAFAIWDRRRRELFLARDRLGVKPLYYAVTDDGSLYFGSEIKAILASGAVSPALNVDVVPDYLANHAPSAEHTLFAGIKRLLPGHTLTWRDGAVRVDAYWDLRMPPAPVVDHRSERDMVAGYRDALREAVRLCLMSDVPLGSFLSGGVDSAAITGLMSELLGGGVKTFSVAFADREANELHYARLVANRFKTDHHEVVVSPNEFFGALPQLVWHEDEPIAHPSSVPLYFVSRLAAGHVKVVLTGEGADETLAGYGRYRTTIYNLALGRAWERLGGARLRGPARRIVDALPANARTRHRLSRTFLYLPADLTTLYFDNFAVFSRQQQSQLLSTECRARLGAIDPYATMQDYVQRDDHASLLNQVLYADTKTYLHELLMKQDQMSMAASIESRVPFLDHPLIEFAAQLPERMKLRGLTAKHVLREAMKGFLPPEVLSRAKMGFPVPIGRWFRGPFQLVLDEYVLGSRAANRGLFDSAYVRDLVAQHARGEANHSERLWSLVNMEIWQRIFLDAESVSDVSSSMTRVIETSSPPQSVSVPVSLPSPSLTESKT
jgi:asparagine synthase (glutamine-hydrolysing)